MRSCAKSYCACRRTQNAALLQPMRSRASAIAGEMPVRPFSRREDAEINVAAGSGRAGDARTEPDDAAHLRPALTDFPSPSAHRALNGLLIVPFDNERSRRVVPSMASVPQVGLRLPQPVGVSGAHPRIVANGVLGRSTGTSAAQTAGASSTQRCSNRCVPRQRAEKASRTGKMG